MIDRFELLLRKTRRALSRSEWAVRLLRLPTSQGTETQPGLLVVQLDGLPHAELKRAVENGTTPFLRRLIEKEGYRLQPVYAGVPSTTPAFQGELFYGVKGTVPSFSFLDKKSGRIVKMYEHDPAAAIERTLAKQPGLLTGGSAYNDIFTGGAADPRFCMASMGWGDFLRTAHPLALPLLALTHFYSIARGAALLLAEVFLALGGFATGVSRGYDLRMELKFIPTRVAICTLLREIVALGAMIDLARGMPIVHVNFVGYDEQAHRRGPSSRLARWSLRGLDAVIRRLVHSARRSTKRTYDVWVCSDHGQEATDSYVLRYGTSIHDAVAKVFRNHSIEAEVPAEPRRGVQSQRGVLLSETLLRALIPGADSTAQWAAPGKLVVTAMGPLGHVYSPRRLDTEERDTIARDLVSTAHIPLVLAATGPDIAMGWNASGALLLPRDASRILGADHPYLDEAARDLVQLCHHANAGDLVISGWRLDAKPLSFPEENGAHGGPGPAETSAFLLAPGDTDLRREEDALRALDLHRAARAVLEGTGRRRRARRDTDQRRLRIMTYNVHSCVGMDGKLSPERVARVIARYDPDVVALQELDLGRQRTGGVDQAQVIAEDLDMLFHFHPTVTIEDEQFGHAIFSKVPMRLVRSGPLPQLEGRADLEPRGAIWVQIEAGDRIFQLLNVHLSLHPRERRRQADALIGPEWLASSDCRRPRVLCGDLNALPRSPACRRIGTLLRDCQVGRDGHRPRNTFFSRYPLGRIDHVFVDAEVRISHVDVPSTELTRVASDHLPLIVDVELGEHSAPP